MTRPVQPDGRVHGVTIACPGEKDRWLLIRRSEHVAAPGRICFPGGGVELEESRRDAAIREFREEVGAEVRLEREVWKRVCPGKPLTLFGWLGRMTGTVLSPDPQEVSEVLWLTLDEAASHPDALEETDDFCRAIREALQD